MARLLVNSDCSKRLSTFINSEYFNVNSNIAKSQYWENESSKLQTSVQNDSIDISGNSGFYVPSKASVINRIFTKLVKVINKPS